MSNNKKLTVFIGLLILLAYSFLMFFGIDTGVKSKVELSAFVFTIVDELILFGIILFLGNKKHNTYVKLGLTSITFIYLLCSLLLNIVFNNIFSTLRGILVTNFGLLLIYLLIIVIIFSFKKENQQ